MPFMFSCIVRGRRRSLKTENEMVIFFEEKEGTVLLLSSPRLRIGLVGGILCLGTSSHDSSILVIVYDRGNLGIASYMFLCWKSKEKR